MRCKKCRKEIGKDYIFCPHCGKKQVTTKRKKNKRPNGAGTVYKRADLKAHPWVAATPKKKDNPSEIIGYYETEKEAYQVVDQFLKTPTTKLNITLKELYEEWKPIGLKDKSKQLEDSYRAAYNKLKPLHDVKFRELRTGQYQEIINSYDLSRSSLSDVKTLAGLLYQYAMQNDIVHKNYAEFIKLPAEDKKVLPIFNDLELKTVKKNIGKVEFADWIYFMCYTGLRITEFLTLTKFQVYQKDRIVALHGGLKTNAGKDKIVPVHDNIKPILFKQMSKNGQVIFCKDDGSPYKTNYYRESCFYPALEEMDIQKNEKPYRLTPHATRRTFATMLSTAGVSEEDFIAMMGHADMKVGIESYIFQSAEKLQPSIDRLS